MMLFVSFVVLLKKGLFVSLKKKVIRMQIFRAMIAGGAAPEIELSVRLAEYAQSLSGVHQYCIRAFAEALEVIPYTLAENAGLNPIATVTELRNRHAQNDTNAGINVRKVLIHHWIQCHARKTIFFSTGSYLKYSGRKCRSTITCFG